METGKILEQFQSLPSEYHWALGVPAVLRAIERNKPVVHKGRKSCLYVLLTLSQRFGMAWPLIALVGVVELFKLVCQQYVLVRDRRKNEGNYPERFFVGGGVPKEEELFRSYSEEHSTEVERLHQYKIETFAFWHRVGLVPAFRSLFSSLAVARMAIDALSSKEAAWRVDFLTRIGTRVGYYAYLRSWFEMLLIRTGSSLEEVVFTLSTTAAFAATDTGINTGYLQHGAINYHDLFPAFSRIQVLTAYEATFIRYMLPKAYVTIHSPPRKKLRPSQMASEILITSCPEGDDVEYMLGVMPLIRWAAMKQVTVRVRLHPSEDATFFWSDYEKAGRVIIEEGRLDFFETIYRLRPRLLVSWVSTTLIDVLECGVIPVSVCSHDDECLERLVYPILEHCLQWPKDSESIGRLLDDNDYYTSVLSELSDGLAGTVA